MQNDAMRGIQELNCRRRGQNSVRNTIERKGFLELNQYWEKAVQRKARLVHQRAACRIMQLLFKGSSRVGY